MTNNEKIDEIISGLKLLEKQYVFLTKKLKELKEKDEDYEKPSCGPDCC